jgi:hypothetical protein
VLEPGSSPTSGKMYPQVRGFFVFFRVDIVHTLASDLIFRVWGPGNGLFGCMGERLPTADRGPPCGASAGSSSLFGLPSGFRVHRFMVARAPYNMTC